MAGRGLAWRFGGDFLRDFVPGFYIRAKCALGQPLMMKVMGILAGRNVVGIISVVARRNFSVEYLAKQRCVAN